MGQRLLVKRWYAQVAIQQSNIHAPGPVDAGCNLLSVGRRITLQDMSPDYAGKL